MSEEANKQTDPAPHEEHAEPKSEDAPKQASADFISLKVANQDGSEVFFKIKKHTPLKKLIDAYCG